MRPCRRAQVLACCAAESSVSKRGLPALFAQPVWQMLGRLCALLPFCDKADADGDSEDSVLAVRSNALAADGEPCPAPPRYIVSLASAQPAPQLAGVPGTFDYGGVKFPRGRVDALGLQTVVITTRCDTTVQTLTDWCRVWLALPTGSIVQLTPPRRLRSSVGVAQPTFTVEQARLGARADHVAAGAELLPTSVAVVPRCGICLEAAVQERWCCGGAHTLMRRHTYCAPCMQTYATNVLTMRSAEGGTMLRCPALGCTYYLSSEEAQRLVPQTQLAELRRKRDAQLRARCARIQSGEEGGPLQALLHAKVAQPCPGCSVVVVKDGGCPHVHCSLCGCTFYWGWC